MKDVTAGVREAGAAPSLSGKDGRGARMHPLDDRLEVLTRKWTLVIVGVLGTQERFRFSALADALPGISPRTLSDRLKELETLGFVTREQFNEVPLRVEYALTPDGEHMREATLPLLAWAEDWASVRSPPVPRG